MIGTFFRAIASLPTVAARAAIDKLKARKRQSAPAESGAPMEASQQSDVAPPAAPYPATKVVRVGKLPNGSLVINNGFNLFCFDLGSSVLLTVVPTDDGGFGVQRESNGAKVVVAKFGERSTAEDVVGKVFAAYAGKSRGGFRTWLKVGALAAIGYVAISTAMARFSAPSPDAQGSSIPGVSMNIPYAAGPNAGLDLSNPAKLTLGSSEPASGPSVAEQASGGYVFKPLAAPNPPLFEAPKLNCIGSSPAPSK